MVLSSSGSEKSKPVLALSSAVNIDEAQVTMTLSNADLP